MIVMTISGPQGSGKTKLAEKIKAMEAENLEFPKDIQFPPSNWFMRLFWTPPRSDRQITIIEADGLSKKAIKFAMREASKRPLFTHGTNLCIVVKSNA